MMKIDKQIKVLHIQASMRSGGVAVFLYNYQKNIDQSKVIFDYIVHVDDEGMLEKKIKNQFESTVYHLPRFRHIIKNFFLTRKIIKEGNYQIVHVHHTNKSFIQLFAAWTCGVPVRIAHSHNIVVSHGISKLSNWIYDKLTCLFANYYFACSDDAGISVFGKKVKENKYFKIRNAIEVDSFSFRNDVRIKIRKELGISDKFVVCNVGRFTEQKNHDRLISIFSDFVKKNPQSVLLLIGEGELEEHIKNKVEEYGIQDSVLFLGKSDRVNEFMQASDVFLLPSLYEGLGIVLVEAQVSGLHCIASQDVIPGEVNLTGLVHFVSLDEENEIWVKELEKYKRTDRIDRSKEIKASGYDIHKEAVKLQKWYIEVIKNEE